MFTRLRHGWLALTLLPGLLFNSRQRALFREIQAFEQSLPSALKQPLPDALRQLTPTAGAAPASESALRNLSDLAVLLDRHSPLGLCLRRSLLRYHFLRRAGVPVVLQFGAKFSRGQPDRDINGHAWLTMNGTAYYEDDENWRGFTIMFAFPSQK
jgi:hypothetical protein